MKKFIWLFAIILLLYNCKNERANRHVTNRADFAITNITLIDGTGSEAQNNKTIFIKDGRIAKIEETKEETKADSIINGAGKYMIPGLFDAHYHFPRNRERAFRQLIHFGVTSIFNTGSSYTSYEMIKDDIRLEKADSLIAPNIYYTSYYVTIPGAHPAKHLDKETGIITGNMSVNENSNIYIIKSEEDIAGFVKEAKEGGAFAMKLTIEDGPAPPFVDRISQDYVNRVVKEAKQQNIKVFAHINDTIELEMGLKGGVDGFVHSLTTRHFWGDTNKELLDQMIADSIPMITTNMLIKSAFYPFNPEWRESSEWQIYEEDQIAEIDDFEPVYKKQVEPLLKQFLGFEDFKIEELQPFMNNFQMLYDKGVLLVVGTDVSALAYIQSGHSVHEELQLLQLGGMKPENIIQCATLNAAKMLEVDEDYGSLEEGKVADMILLDENPLEDIANTLSINTVYKRGKAQPRIEVK